MLPIEHGRFGKKENATQRGRALSQPPIVHDDGRHRNRPPQERPIEQDGAAGDEVLEEEAPERMRGRVLQPLIPKKGRMDRAKIAIHHGEIRMDQHGMVHAPGGLVGAEQGELALQLVRRPDVVLVRQGDVGRSLIQGMLQEGPEARDRSEIAPPVREQAYGLTMRWLGAFA